MVLVVLFEKFDCCDYVPHVDKKMICWYHFYWN